MPSEQDQRDTAANQFIAGLGAAMASANYAVTMVRNTMDLTSRAYGLDNQHLALPNYVQVGNQSGDGLYVVNPESYLSIALGVQNGILLWRAAIQLTAAPHRRVLHE